MLEMLQRMPEYVLYRLVRNDVDHRVRPRQVLIEQGPDVSGLFIVLNGLFLVTTGTRCHSPVGKQPAFM